MNASARSGFAIAILAFMSNLGLGAFIAICTPFCGIVWGGAAGFLAIYWSNAESEEQSPARRGATAGAIAGVGAVLGLLVGLILQVAVLGSQELMMEILQDMSRDFGNLDLSNEVISLIQWLSLGFTACCLGLLNVVVMAVGGAVAANVYSSSRGQTETT